MKDIQKNKLVVILGPTASGKTALSIILARKFNGEIVSADSRQVYKKMDIGTGKITKKEMRGVPHHLLDVANPKTKYSVARYQKKSTKTINTISKKGKLAFLVGGSAFYIYSVVDGYQFPDMKANPILRQQLEKKSLQELQKMLKELDPRRYKTIETQNKRRLVRAIEIAKELGSVPELNKNPQFDCLLLGIKKEKEKLAKLIHKRQIKQFKQGMIKEVKNLKKSGVSWKRLDSFGLEYRWIARYLQNKINRPEMEERLETDTIKFSKRQMTWFKKDARIHWIKTQKQAEQLVKKFLK